MISYLIGHELRLLWRNRPMRVLLAFLFLAIIVSALISTLRLGDLARERAQAIAADQQVWMTQGEQNPHSAAHFGRYAFKPVSALAAFDPGSLDTAGVAIWLEGHYQDPAQFRRIEDQSRTLRLTQLSPAWVLQVFGSLVVVIALFGTIAGEREDGTLRQLLATGVGARRFAVAKLIAVAIALSAVLGVALSAAFAIVTLTTDMRIVVDDMARLAWTVVAYGLFFVAIAGVCVTVSALATSRRSALAVLTGLWVSTVLLVLLVAADVGRALAPDPDGREVHRSIMKSSNAYFADQPAREAFLNATLRKYGVERREDLPINFYGYDLQHSEVVAQPAFKRIYGEIDARHATQETPLRVAATLLPGLGLSLLSAGFAGSDRWHHLSFVADAEGHRRRTVKQLNDDLTYSDPKVEEHVANERLWAQVAGFAGTVPSLSRMWGRYAGLMVLLSVQAVIALLLAGWALSRSARTVRSA